ncbi:hypothetical protein TanjilG_04948 [Lupinus angustifolius]|uniref:Auxin response factor n=1 Tax=Lupinus angustifolius TaxID=3871 RepID=A0A1J7IP50_LUPAN|nr:PREDICTED: auxin response factor 17-like [Lupinus angustifolius]XP_019438564.1 PREDICTED: auxin response factor 17-like [Lupinus angustifolius]OIW14515.1 hypothetical protein TanjilG_04948 [Lupinus angustifolius]
MRRQLSTNPPLPPPSPPSQPSPIDAAIWRACAGASAQIPTVNSRVYYFLQGHIDQASSTPKKLSPNVYSTPYVLARIVEVQFLADHNTDEVFVKLVLQPINRGSVSQFLLTPRRTDSAGENRNGSGDGDENAVVSFAKILTPSDANNGGGFSVPRFCADSIFPPLNFQEDPPLQNLRVIDIHGIVWEFRHIYRGTPRRHLLTTGWSKFVNFKNLVAGDSVVFVKNSKGELFAGVRRAKRSSSRGCGGGGNGTDWCAMMLSVGGVRKRDEEGEKKKQEEKVVKEGFSRNGKGRLEPEKVAEAAELAVRGMPFEVVYYPSTGWSDFVVKAEIVDEASRVMWSPGMRVKMAVETEDSSRMSWFQGTVSAVCVPENGQWQGSPWHMLQVAWDEPEVLQNAKLVSPWQVELVSATPALHTAFTPPKRFRAAHGSLVLTDGEGDPFFPMTGYSNSTMGQLNRTLSSYGTFPAGMQGARHDFFSTLDVYNFSGNMSRLYFANSFGNNSAPSLNTLSTELNIGSSQSDNLSPDSQGSLHSFGIEFFGAHNCKSTKAGSGSIQLFGATIETKQPIESVLHLPCYTSHDSSKGCTEIKVMDKLEYSLGYSKMLDRLDDGLDDGQCNL